jgi:hypothetical protein
MGDVVRFIPKRDLERARLIQEARAIYEGILPTETGLAGEQRARRNERTPNGEKPSPT